MYGREPVPNVSKFMYIYIVNPKLKVLEQCQVAHFTLISVLCEASLTKSSSEQFQHYEHFQSKLELFSENVFITDILNHLFIFH